MPMVLDLPPGEHRNAYFRNEKELIESIEKSRLSTNVQSTQRQYTASIERIRVDMEPKESGHPVDMEPIENRYRVGA